MSTAADTDKRLRTLLDERTALLARRGLAQTRATTTRAHLVCAVGGERYGLPLAQIAAVLPDKSCTALPGAAPGLRGIVALSGTIVSVINLGTALGLTAALPSDAESTTGHLVRLRSQEPPVALAVERVIGIARIGTPVGAAADGEPSGGLGADAVSGYAPPGSDTTGGIAEGFSLVDLPRLLRRYLP